VSVSVRIPKKRVAPEYIEFIPVTDPVPVTVPQQRTGAHINFFTVRQSVTITVGISGIGAVCMDFISITQTILIAVRSDRIRVGRIYFFSISQPIII
jgi:hypothetical protein